MSKKLCLFASLGAVLLLTGCITLDVQNVIRADGSGEKVMITALDNSVYEMIKSATPEPGKEAADPFQDLWDRCKEEPRAKCEEYVDAEKELTGVRASVPFDSLDELIALSDDPLFGGTDEITFERSGGTTTMNVVLHTKEVGSEVAEGSRELETTPEPQATLTAEEEEMQRALLEAMDINFLYRVTAPASISAYTPRENATYDEAENTVTWDIDLLAEEPVQELSLTWGGTPIEAEEPTAEPTAEATAKPAPTAPVEPEATQAPPPEPTSAPASPLPTKGLCGLCPCLPGLALPLLALGGVLVVRRRQSP